MTQPEFGARPRNRGGFVCRVPHFQTDPDSFFWDAELGILLIKLIDQLRFVG